MKVLDMFRVYSSILDWIDEAYSGGIILTKTDIWFLAEVLKRKDKIEDLMAKAIDNGIEYWLVDKEKGGLENVWN